MSNIWIAAGAFSCALAVIIGAFGAHGLKDVLTDDYSRSVYEKGNLYHFIHSIALIVNGILSKIFSQLDFMISGYLFLLGIILFSFSLYALAITDIKKLGAITPLGGICFIFAWLYIGFKVYNS
tara:strand:- start:126 stop:497 length:372 start_codon:yes stop_codon:yes gene_type:complete